MSHVSLLKAKFESKDKTNDPVFLKNVNAEPNRSPKRRISNQFSQEQPKLHTNPIRKSPKNIIHNKQNESIDAVERRRAFQQQRRQQKGMPADSSSPQPNHPTHYHQSQPIAQNNKISPPIRPPRPSSFSKIDQHQPTNKQSNSQGRQIQRPKQPINRPSKFSVHHSSQTSGQNQNKTTSHDNHQINQNNQPSLPTQHTKQSSNSSTQESNNPSHIRQDSQAEIKRKAFQDRRRIAKERERQKIQEELEINPNPPSADLYNPTTPTNDNRQNNQIVDDITLSHELQQWDLDLTNSLQSHQQQQIQQTIQQKIGEMNIKDIKNLPSRNDNTSSQNDDFWDFGDNPAPKPQFQLDVNSIVSYCQGILELRSEDMFFFQEQVEEILSTGSEPAQKSRIEYLINSYKKNEFWRIERLGKGAFGQVFLGIRRSDREQVAIKVIDLEESKDDITIITREIQALAQSRGCPQLTTYHGSVVCGYELWIIMEYLLGGSIQDIIKVNPLTEQLCAVVAREVLIGLRYLLRENKFHRDIKAANILLAANGQSKLADFGATAQLSDTSRAATFVGSPFWMAPEIMTSQKYDEKADIWSLGITCIEMVKGKPPLSHLPPLRLVTHIPHSPPPYLKGDFSNEFKHFIKSCLVKDPLKRPSLHVLLKHPWIAKAGSISSLKKIIK